MEKLNALILEQKLLAVCLESRIHQSTPGTPISPEVKNYLCCKRLNKAWRVFGTAQTLYYTVNTCDLMPSGCTNWFHASVTLLFCDLPVFAHIHNKIEDMDKPIGTRALLHTDAFILLLHHLKPFRWCFDPKTYKCTSVQCEILNINSHLHNAAALNPQPISTKWIVSITNNRVINVMKTKMKA